MSAIGDLGNVLIKLYDEYNSKTPKKLKIVDAYMLYILLTGVIQFLYCCLVGTFPFNSFLSGFISSVGSFILAGKSCFIYLFICKISLLNNVTFPLLMIMNMNTTC